MATAAATVAANATGNHDPVYAAKLPMLPAKKPEPIPSIATPLAIGCFNTWASHPHREG
jgi:hypothetical protein